LENLKVEPFDEKLRRYKSNWLRHVIRMSSSRIAKIVLNCRPNGRRRLGRPLKRVAIGRERNKSIEASLVMDDDDDDETWWCIKEPLGCKCLTTLF